MVKYKPMMTKKEIVKRKAWHEQVYQNLKSITEQIEIKILGYKFCVLSGMFAPLWYDSTLLAKIVKKNTKQGDFVLDLGTGSGIMAAIAAKKASKVVAVDINPVALKCCHINIMNLKLDDKIKVFKSNLFSKLKNKFDVIIFNPPFRWFKPRDMLEKSITDEKYKTLTKFLSEAKKHLKKKGRIILVFSNSGDLKYLEHLIERNRYKSKILGTQKEEWRNQIVYELTVI